MLVSDFHYDLPEDLIAQRPPAVRGSSRMMTLDRRTGAYANHLFTDLPSLLQPGDLLILNDSRVLPARLYATRAGLTTQHNSPSPTGLVEVLLTEHLPNPEGHNDWRVLVKPAKKIQPGETLHFASPAPAPELSSRSESAPSSQTPTNLSSRPESVLSSQTPTNLSSRPESALFADAAERPAVSAPALTAQVLTTADYGERILRFSPTENFHVTLEAIGHLPLPPYIHRSKSAPNTPEDRERYQTVYSTPLALDPGPSPSGSSAAPTAGLHFTPEVLAQLRAHKVEVQTITLHVGLGTFQPVRADRTEDIHLHAEPYTLSATTAEAINRAKSEGRRIIAVGTTTTRTLEHIARETDRTGQPIAAHSGSTSLFLSPTLNDDFKLVQGLLTNFHLPSSTLLMLVSALAGREAVLRAYAHAVKQRYRFFSYGDCMLIT